VGGVTYDRAVYAQGLKGFVGTVCLSVYASIDQSINLDK